MFVHPLARALEARGLSQTRLAALAQVSQASISLVINRKRGGRFSEASARRILAALRRVRCKPGNRRPPLELADLLIGNRCRPPRRRAA